MSAGAIRAGSRASGLPTRPASGRLCLFHHDPDHDDAFMDKIEAEAEAARPGTIVASEGLQIDL